MRRVIAIGAIVAVGTLGVPATAGAFSVSVSEDGTMTVTDGVIIGISFDGSQYQIGDASSNASVTPPCSATGPDSAACPAGTVARIDATATLSLQLDDGGGPDAVQIPSTMTLTGFVTQGYGGDGNDLIVSNHPSSHDDLRGGPGNDTIRAGPSNGNVAMDHLQGGPGDDVLNGGVGPDIIMGGPGIDRLEYAGRTDALKVALPEGTASGIGNGGSADGPGSRDTLSEVENVTGGSGADSLTGNSLANAIDGGGGKDLIDGGAGADQLRGGGGADSLTGGKGADALLGQGGIDRLFARDRIRDTRINCGPGKNSRERAKRDRRDPPAKSC